MRTLILGIGNPILGDDGIGFHIAQELAKQVKDENVDIKDASEDGLNLLEFIMGYDRLIVIDAIMTEGEKVGEIYRLKPENTGELVCSVTSPHHLNLATTIEIGKKLFGEQIPEEVIVFAIGTQEVTRVTEKMTERVKESYTKGGKSCFRRAQFNLSHL